MQAFGHHQSIYWWAYVLMKVEQNECEKLSAYESLLSFLMTCCSKGKATP